MREELDKARQEASQAREELNKLRLELDELKNSKRENTGRGRKIISDSSDFSSEGNRRELRKRKKKGSPKEKKEGKTMEPDSGKVEALMKIDPPEALTVEPHETIELKGDDEARKKKILPPREEWPLAIRPALQGKVKILEDLHLEGHTVRIVDSKEKGKKKTTVLSSASEEKKGEAPLPYGAINSPFGQVVERDSHVLWVN